MPTPILGLMNNMKTANTIPKTAKPIPPIHAQAFPVQMPNARQKLSAAKTNVVVDSRVQLWRIVSLLIAPSKSNRPSTISRITRKVIPLGVFRSDK